MKRIQKHLWLLCALISLCLIFATPALALTSGSEITSSQEVTSNQEVTDVKNSSFAVGYEASIPLCYGLTFTCNLNQSWAIQGLVTMSPQPIMLSTLKVSYKIKQSDQSNTYLFALAGQFEDGYFRDFHQRVRGYGIGVGTEFTPKFYPDNYKNYLEIGAIGFDSPEYNPSLIFNAGVKVFLN